MFCSFLKHDALHDILKFRSCTRLQSHLIFKAALAESKRSGSSVWLERLPVTQEVASSSLVRTAVKSPDTLLIDVSGLCQFHEDASYRLYSTVLASLS